LDLLTCPPLTFEAPDLDTFRCLKVALDTARIPGAACAILNGANEEAVAAFLADKVGFLQIADLVEEALQTVPNVVDPTLEDILAADAAARDCVRARIS
jgi:1-deoxy-D-xylulose-5-phosphate reductoisomerase